MMISQEKRKEINALHTKICKHPLFANSVTYTTLLNYLVEKAITGEDLKEYTIGSDLFGENYADDKNDGTVRSKMYKLRNKLSQYYEGAGKKDALRFTIEKGQYNLSFISADERVNNTRNIHFSVSYKSLALASLLLLIGVGIILFIKGHQNSSPRMWNSFFKKDAKNIVVVSDHYVVNELLSDNQYHAVLFNDIINSSTLYSYKEANPDRKLLPTDYTLMSKMGPYGIKLISKWLFSYNADYEIILESRLNSEDVSLNNLIFIGQFKSMNISSSIFLKDSKVFTTYLDGFKCVRNGEEKIYNTQYKPNSKKEYAMVSFTSHSEGKNAFYFVSNNDIGVLATLKRFTNKQWLTEFESQVPNECKAFNALFEVSGLQRTDVSCNLIEVEFFE